MFFWNRITCNAGDPVSILGLGRSPGEGINYPLQYSWTCLVAQLVKNLPSKQETWVQSLGWEDPLEKGNTALKMFKLTVVSVDTFAVVA